MKREYTLVIALTVAIVAFALVIEVMFSGSHVSQILTTVPVPTPS